MEDVLRIKCKLILDNNNRVTRLAIDFKCRECKVYHKNVEDPQKLHDDVETVTNYSYLGDRITSCGCEAAVISRTRI